MKRGFIMVDENRGKRIAPGYVQVCSNCQGKFNVSVFGEGYPNRDDEYVCGLHWCHPDATGNSADGDMYAYGKGHLTKGFATGGMALDEDGKVTGAKMHDEWHVCGHEWNETKMWIYCDDKVIGPIDITEESMENAFHRAHYMILNFALGGSWAGTPNAVKGTVLPQAFEIDWVKVWQ